MPDNPEETVVTEEPLTDEQALALRARLARHYGEPVKPVSEYCQSFREWRQAIAEKLKQESNPNVPLRPLLSDHERERWQEINDALLVLDLAVVKSNLLYRLIYLDLPLRTERCPLHAGLWSGYGYCPHGCTLGDGYDMTGWLPTATEPEPVKVAPPEPMMPTGGEQGAQE